MKEQKTNFDTETARDDSDVILDVRNLDVYLNTYSGRIHAVRDVSFTLKKGETLVVVGESGCGKSMTARAIMQLLPEKISEVGERSQILFNGTDILKMPEKKKETELRGKYISMIFQDPTTFLNPTMTVGEQIAESLLLHSKMKKKEAMEQALSLLKMVKITNPEKRIRQYPHELSGGMRQRVMIAMALACEPKILIADEPTTALDVTTQADIMELIRELQEKMGTSVILVTHDREEALSMSDRIALMFSGRLVQTGTPKEVYLRPESRLAADYFGDCVYINGTISGGRFTGGGLDCPVPFLSQEFISQAIPSSFDSPVPGPSVPDGPCRLMLRPGSLEPDRTGGYFLTVEQVSFRGGSVLVSLRSDDGALWKKAFSGPVDLAPGDRIQASVRTQDGVLFPV